VDAHLRRLTVPTHRQRHAQRALERTAADGGGETGAVRLDKWLWAARFYKTRELAQQAIESGRVRLDDERIKPAHPVRIGHVYTIVRDGLPWKIEVTGLSDRRGAATVARELYREDEASIAERQRIIALNRSAGPVFKGRPTKRQRRKIEDFLAEP
jgi:ribosome-associated heat shock protein Hsp15